MKNKQDRRWYNMAADPQNAAKATIYIYDYIGGWDGLTAKQFISDLADIGNVAEIELRINSGGGAVTDAVAIMNALQRHPATINIYVDALAASCASRMLCIGDTVTIASNAMIMIHQTWTWLSGNAADLRKEADVLDKFDDGLANDYAKRTGKTIDEIKQAMAEETWFTAEEALDWGIVDQIGDEQKAAASIAPDHLARLNNVPDIVKARFAMAASASAVADVVLENIIANPPAPAAPAADATPTFTPTPLALLLRKQAFNEKHQS